MKKGEKHAEPVISMQNIEKEFSGVKALDGITFDVYAGEIHCLVGENGAGKSTLMKILSGAYRPSAGQVSFAGGPTYDYLTPALSRKLGINIVYQENDLVPSMNVVENIFVGSEKANSFGLVQYDEMKKYTCDLIADMGLKLDPEAKAENLSVSDQQFVKILKALSSNPQVLIMDEPTSMFNAEDSQKVLDLTRNIASKNIAVIFISHFLKEVVEIADRITVIRDGKVISTLDNRGHDTPYEIITKDMVGRSVEMFYQKEKNEIGDIFLEVKNLKLTKDSPTINFYVRKGEVLGFAGMVGSGRSEIMRAVFGADSRYSGEIYIDKKRVFNRNPAESIDNSIAFITEDRQKYGLFLQQSVLENTTLVGLKKVIKGKFVNIKKHPPLIQNIITSLNIKVPSVWTEAIYLSGGNQQKVVLGKWLFAGQDIYIFDEPTRGIDVNAKTEFYKQMSKLTREGKSIIMISSDMPELISMSDRVMVVRDGAIDCELVGDQINEQRIINRALGVRKNDKE